jgi:hypothetical protein
MYITIRPLLTILTLPQYGSALAEANIRFLEEEYCRLYCLRKFLAVEEEFAVDRVNRLRVTDPERLEAETSLETTRMIIKGICNGIIYLDEVLRPKLAQLDTQRMNDCVQWFNRRMCLYDPSFEKRLAANHSRYRNANYYVRFYRYKGPESYRLASGTID